MTEARSRKFRAQREDPVEEVDSKGIREETSSREDDEAQILTLGAQTCTFVFMHTLW